MSWRVFLAALAGVVIFGGSAIATKVAVSAIDAIDVSIMRTVIGGLVALPLTLALRIGLPRSRQQRVLLLVSGFCGFIAFPLLFTLGVSLTTANHATMILAILPVLTGAIALFWDRQRPQALWWLGCTIAFAGEVLLLYDPAASNGEASIRGDLLVWVSTLFASLGYVAGARLVGLAVPGNRRHRGRLHSLVLGARHRRYCARRPVPVPAADLGRYPGLVDTGGKYIVDLYARVVNHHGRRHSRVSRKVTLCPIPLHCHCANIFTHPPSPRVLPPY
ncbi:MAG: DMT family transporter [Gammaproteobacteria bacterium]|nr:DMT family transporter [Gammaproteobacteria bacterium]